MSLLLHRLGFVVYDTEDNRVVYTVFEVLNSRGLAVDWLDKTKSILMGRSYELSSSVAVAEAEIQGLQSIWGQIYREIAKANVAGDEILRVTATLYYSPGVAKPRPAEECLGFVRKECNNSGSRVLYRSAYWTWRGSSSSCMELTTFAQLRRFYMLGCWPWR